MMPLLANRLLIVEDDRNALAGLQELLREEGFLVCGVTDGCRALEAVAHETFDMVLCDCCLPGMDGLRLCCELRRSQPHLTFFLVTAYRNTELIHAARQRGIEKVIGKPIIFSELLETLTAAAARLRGGSDYREHTEVDFRITAAIF
jgi:CheY-like chemotaxis protein